MTEHQAGACRSVDTEYLRTIIQKLMDLPPIREKLVADISAEIRHGVYETPEKVDIAIERLLEDLS